MHTSESYSGELGTIAAARRTVTAFLSRARTAGHVTTLTPEASYGAQLVVSELVSNAVKHAGGACGLDLRITKVRVEITVWDTSPHDAVMAQPDPSRIGGHGLEIVTALCGGFRVSPTPTGKQVTAWLPLG